MKVTFCVGLTCRGGGGGAGGATTAAAALAFVFTAGIGPVTLYSGRDRMGEEEEEDEDEEEEDEDGRRKKKGEKGRLSWKG